MNYFLYFGYIIYTLFVVLRYRDGVDDFLCP